MNNPQKEKWGIKHDVRNALFCSIMGIAMNTIQQEQYISMQQLKTNICEAEMYDLKVLLRRRTAYCHC